MGSPTGKKRIGSMRMMSVLVQDASQGSLLSSIGRHTCQMERINKLLQPLLPEDIRGRCKAICLSKENTLSICAPSSAWLTRLRFHLAEIQRRMRRDPELSQFRKIRILVIPQHHDNANASAALPLPLAVSAESGRVIRSAAKSILNPNLRNSLERLAASLDDAKRD
ncbi:MAG: DciA family protein [Candidatus Eutrophobiaceae bacterium]